MQKEAWLRTYGDYYTTNGYSNPPWQIYDQFLKVVEGSGPILELACGNGLLLRYLCDLSGHQFQPYGVDINADAIRQARSAVFPERKDCFVHGDLRQGIPFAEKFNAVIANPLYADQGYYEQVGGKIQKLYLDGSMGRLILGCWEALAPGGRLFLWCYDGHVAEIAPYSTSFESSLADLSLGLRPIESGPVSFWVSRRK